MAAANTDLLQQVGIQSATTLDANYTINDATITVASTSGWPTATGITFAMDVIDSAGLQVAGTYNEFVGTVSTATSITNVDYADGTGDRNYTAGATTRVYIPVSKTRENRIVTWGLEEHAQDGTHGDITADSLEVSGTSVLTGAVTLPDSTITTGKINDGAVTSEKLAATIACRAYRNAAVNLTASAAKIVLDAEEFDVGSDWDITNGRFTAPVTGYYQVNATLAADNLNTAGDQIIMYVYVNGAEHAIAKSYIGAAGNDPSVSISTLCSVTSGQYIEMYGFCTTTEAVTTGPSRTFMSVHFVGA